MEETTLKGSSSLNLCLEKKVLIKESCSDTICGEKIQKDAFVKLNRFGSKLPVPKKTYTGPYQTKSPRLSPIKNFKSPIIEVKPKDEIEKLEIDETERYDSDYYENKISSLQESLNDIQMINLETSPREEILFSDDDENKKSESLDSITSNDLINIDEKSDELINLNDTNPNESCEKFLEKNRLLSANLKIDSYEQTSPDYNLKFEININLDKNDEITFKDVECQNDKFINNDLISLDEIVDVNKNNLSENLIDVNNDLIDFNKKIENIKFQKIDKETQKTCQKNDFGCQFDFETIKEKKIKSGNNKKSNNLKIKGNKEKKIKRVDKESCRKLTSKPNRKKIKRPKSDIEYKVRKESDKEINYYSDFEFNYKNNLKMRGDNEIEMLQFVEKFNDRKCKNLYEETYIQPEDPKTLMSEYKRLNYLDDSNTSILKNKKLNINNIIYDEKYKNNNSKGDYEMNHQQILTTETVHVFETGFENDSPKNVEYVKNLESIKENIKIIQENIKEESLKRNDKDLENINSSSNFIYWRKPNRTGLSESDSVVDGCENHHSQALSCARIERQIRNCCSDLCLTKSSETSFKLSSSEIDLRNYSSYQNIQNEENDNVKIVSPEKHRKLNNIEEEESLKKKILSTENLLNDTTQCDMLDLKQVLSTIPESNSNFSSQNEMETSIYDSCSIVTPRFLEILKTVLEPSQNEEVDDEMMKVSRKHCQKLLLIDKKNLGNVFDEKSKFFLPEIRKSEKRIIKRNSSPKKITLPEILTWRTRSTSKNDSPSSFRTLQTPKIVYYRKEGTKRF